MKMTTNIGTVDRMLRLVVGIVLIALTLFGVIGLWGWLGLVPIATAFLRFCPAYAIFGVKTCAS